jgi:VIT1/CCC1 family predicted Fe2+/Mn2+ transporter
MTRAASGGSQDGDAALPGAAAGRDSRLAALAGQIRRSFLGSVGSIVFGMEDGTVSIFGLVFGVAAAAPDSRVVLLAGGTGAISAAVSMMAGTFLDVESTNDRAAARAAQQRARYAASPATEDLAVHRRLVAAGLSEPEAATVTGIIGQHPETRLKIAAAVSPGAADEATRQSPVVQSLWMFFTDLLAAAVPVIPFALFSLATARIVSLLVTLLLLVFLGIGRAMIGHRRLLPTIAETIGIAAAAAVAGLAIGKLIS